MLTLILRLYSVITFIKSESLGNGSVGIEEYFDARDSSSLEQTNTLELNDRKPKESDEKTIPFKKTNTKIVPEFDSTEKFYIGHSYLFNASKSGGIYLETFLDKYYLLQNTLKTLLKTKLLTDQEKIDILDAEFQVSKINLPSKSKNDKEYKAISDFYISLVNLYLAPPMKQHYGADLANLINLFKYISLRLDNPWGFNGIIAFNTSTLALFLTEWKDTHFMSIEANKNKIGRIKSQLENVYKTLLSDFEDFNKKITSWKNTSKDENPCSNTSKGDIEEIKKLYSDTEFKQKFGSREHSIREILKQIFELYNNAEKSENFKDGNKKPTVETVKSEIENLFICTNAINSYFILLDHLFKFVTLESKNTKETMVLQEAISSAIINSILSHCYDNVLCGGESNKNRFEDENIQIWLDNKLNTLLARPFILNYNMKDPTLFYFFLENNSEILQLNDTNIKDLSHDVKEDYLSQLKSLEKFMDKQKNNKEETKEKANKIKEKIREIKNLLKLEKEDASTQNTEHEEQEKDNDQTGNNEVPVPKKQAITLMGEKQKLPGNQDDDGITDSNKEITEEKKENAGLYKIAIILGVLFIAIITFLVIYKSYH